MVNKSIHQQKVNTQPLKSVARAKRSNGTSQLINRLEPTDKMASPSHDELDEEHHDGDGDQKDADEVDEEA